MSERFTYFCVIGCSLLFPLLFSFHPRFGMKGRIGMLFSSMFLPAITFIAWDLIFTREGIWSFNPQRVLGIYLGPLPLEEILFFFFIPYSCVFTYNIICENTSWKLSPKAMKFIVPFSVMLLAATALHDISHYYTSITFSLTAFLIAYHYYVKRSMWLGRYMLSYLFILIPFFITNGILTGSWISSPVVTYDNNYNLGLRLLTIPVEDIFYGFSLVMLTVAAFENKLKKNEARHYNFSV